jgi:integrase
VIETVTQPARSTVGHILPPRAPRRNRTIHLVARTLDALKPEAAAVDWFDAETPGLAIHVTPAGAKTWYLFYTHARVSRRVKLGRYPALGLAKARTEARRARLRIETEGADPAHERREARDAFTIADLGALYIETHAKVKKRTWRDDQWRLDKYVLPAWGTRLVTDITRGDVHALLDRLVADGKPIQANRLQALISKLFNFAIDREHAETNPCHRMAKRGAERARDRVLDDDELRACWRTLDAQPGDAADALKLRLLTGARGGEVHEMRWTDVDLTAATWTQPAASTKNGRASRVPLAATALAILTARRAAASTKETRVFPGLYHQREDLRAFAEIHDGAYRWHDLRRTVASRLAALGVPEHVISRILNHAKRGITATVYNQYEYDAEKRAALESWDRELRRLVTAEVS